MPLINLFLHVEFALFDVLVNFSPLSALCNEFDGLGNFELTACHYTEPT